jgi:hypothetical protein
MTEINLNIGVSKENLQKVKNEIYALLENLLEDEIISLFGDIESKEIR